MESEELIRKCFAEYRPSVSEREWEAISKDARLLRYNKMRRSRNVWIGGGLALIAVAVFVTAALLLKPVKHNAPAQLSTTEPEKIHPSVENTIPSATKNDDLSATAETIVAQTETDVAMVTPSTASVQSHSVATTNSPLAVTPTSTATPTPKTVAQPAASVTTHKPAATQTKPAAQTVQPKTVESEVTYETYPEQDRSLQPDYKLFVPSAFTPNGDGLNDQFLVSANFEPTTFEVSVFSRSSEKVFHSRSINIGWDGTKYGAAVQQGVYLYVIKYTTPEGKTETQKGQILLIK